jgi:hypothetical protein
MAPLLHLGYGLRPILAMFNILPYLWLFLLTGFSLVITFIQHLLDEKWQNLLSD